MLTLHPKTAGTGVGGALALLILWIVSYWVDVPAEVAAAITLIAAAFVSWMASWVPQPKTKEAPK